MSAEKWASKHLTKKGAVSLRSSRGDRAGQVARHSRDKQRQAEKILAYAQKRRKVKQRGLSKE